ncbi:MAG: DUF3467 domain-containing protein [Candidatus Nealsonbacteria bacterium]|nr:MAG: DUF3467 domain-containing protein [Candidatus Nealsonbacteria bacterium]
MKEKKQIKIRARNEDLKGVYSNLMQVFHLKEEFILDFFLNAPPGGMLASRVIVSPEHLKRMIKALQDNIQRYEEKFGKIEEVEVTKEKIGFNVEEN